MFNNINFTKLRSVLGKNLRKARKEKEMTQKELADVIGLTEKSVSSQERGDVMITIPNLIDYCKYFEKDFYYFFAGSEFDFADSKEIIEYAVLLHECDESWKEAVLKFTEYGWSASNHGDDAKQRCMQIPEVASYYEAIGLKKRANDTNPDDEVDKEK